MDLSNREIATLFWFAALFGFAALTGVGGSFLALVRAFLAPTVVGPFLLMVAYPVLCAWLLSLVQLWTWANLQQTTLWIGTFAFVPMLHTAVRTPQHQPLPRQST